MLVAPPSLRFARTLLALLGLAGLLSGLGACSGAPSASDGAAPGSGPPRLLILSSLIGYIEPCGCTLDLLLGGIDRAAARVAAERAEGPTAVLVVGSTFYEGPPPAHRAAQDDAKADLLARALKRLGAAALVTGPGDLARGVERGQALVGASGAAEITANVPGGRGQVLTLGDLKVGVFGLADPANPGLGGPPTDPAPAARAETDRLRAAGAQVVVALAALPRRELRLLARATPGVDLWVLGDHPTEAATVSPVLDGSYLVEAGDRGRHLGRIVLKGDGDGPLTDPVGEAARARRALELQLQMKTRMAMMNKDPDLAAQILALKAQLDEPATTPDTEGSARALVYTLVPLHEGDPREPTVRGWMSEYNDALKALNLASAGEPPPVPPGGSRYLGDAACVDCHADAVEYWKGTRHARAWATLEAADKTFDAECVSCHVVGFQQPGGTVLGRTEGFQNVQCEACHGPGEQHVAGGGDAQHIVRAVPVSTCETCHHPHHSPKFDDAVYRPKILGPGHGRPLAVTPAPHAAAPGAGATIPGPTATPPGPTGTTPAAGPAP